MRDGSSPKQLEQKSLSVMRHNPKKRSAVTDHNRISSTRGRSLLEDPRWWERMDPQCLGPTAKRVRCEPTRNETAHVDQYRNGQSTSRPATPVQSAGFNLQVKKKGNLILSENMWLKPTLELACIESYTSQQNRSIYLRQFKTILILEWHMTFRSQTYNIILLFCHSFHHDRIQGCPPDS